LCFAALWPQGRPATAEEIKRRDLTMFAVGIGTAMRTWRVAAAGAALWAQGRAATGEEIERRDLTVFADGRGLQNNAMLPGRRAIDGAALWAQGRPATAEEIKRGLPVGKGTEVRPWRVAVDGAVTVA